MLETVRELALEKLELLGDAEQLRRRHAEYVLQFLSTTEMAQMDAARHARETAELDNLRAAVEWALRGQHADLALALASALLFPITRPHERIRWLDAALLFGDRADPALYANALVATARGCYVLGDLDRVETLAERSLELFRALETNDGESEALHLIGLTSAEDGESQALHLIGLASGARGELDRARTRFEQALERAQASGEATARYRALHSLGELERRIGSLDRAAALLEEALRLAIDAGNTADAAAIEHGLGDTALAAGDTVSAEHRYLRALSRARELDHRRVIAYCLAGLASVAAKCCEREHAGRLWGASEAFQRALGVELLVYERLLYEEALATVAGPQFERAANATRTAEPEDALAAALAGMT
jgi:tetratricopeptide (TPR) repeat protein